MNEIIRIGDIVMDKDEYALYIGDGCILNPGGSPLYVNPKSKALSRSEFLGILARRKRRYQGWHRDVTTVRPGDAVYYRGEPYFVVSYQDGLTHLSKSDDDENAVRVNEPTVALIMPREIIGVMLRRCSYNKIELTPDTYLNDTIISGLVLPMEENRK